MKRALVLLVALFAAGSLFAAGTGGGGGGSGMSGGPGGSTAPTALDFYNKGYAEANSGQYMQAIDNFKQAIALKPDYAEAYNMLGFSTRKSGDVKGAYAWYDKALKLKPNFPEAREYYGEAYLQDNNLPKAIQQYVVLEKMHSKNADELLEKISDYVDKQVVAER
jgi:tetratricopeptide (TPR) repeat protein